MKVTYTEAEISALNTIKNIDQSDIQHTNQGRTQRKNLIKGFKFTEQEIYNFKRNSSEFKTEEQIEYKKALDKRNEFWKKYHSGNHTSTYELGEIANKSKPALLILYHTLYWGATDEQILEEISEVYKGKVIVGSDLDVY